MLVEEDWEVGVAVEVEETLAVEEALAELLLVAVGVEVDVALADAVLLGLGDGLGMLGFLACADR